MSSDCCTKLRTHAVQIGIASLVVAFFLLAFSCSSLVPQIAFQLDFTQGTIPSTTATTTANSLSKIIPTTTTAAHVSKVAKNVNHPSSLVRHLSSGPLLTSFDSVSSLVSIAQSAAVSSSNSANGTMSLHATWSMFQFCFKMDETVYFPPNARGPNNQTNLQFDYSFCSLINPQCRVDITDFVYNILTLSGLNSTQAQAMIDKINAQGNNALQPQIVGGCDEFNASRAFGALSAITGGICLLFSVLLWRKKIPFIALVIVGGCTVVFSVIGLSIIIDVEQNDSVFSILGSLSALTQVPGMTSSLALGAAFGLLACGVILSFVGFVFLSVELYSRTEGGSRNPFHLQDHAEASMNMSHGLMYREM